MTEIETLLTDLKAADVGRLLIVAMLLTGCGTTREPLRTAPDLRGRDLPCSEILSNLNAASEDHKAKAVKHGLKSNTGTIGSIIAAPFTLGIAPLGYLVYRMTFPSDGGVSDAYTEWEHWDNVAWLKGCAA